MLSVISATDDPEIDLKIALSDLQSAITAVTPGGDRHQDEEAHAALDMALECQRTVYAVRNQEGRAA